MPPLSGGGGGGGWFTNLGWIPAAAAVTAVTVAVTVGVVVVIKPGGEENTPQDFCAALEEGQRDILENVPDSEIQDEADALETIVQAFGGIGRYQTMLDKLVEASPKEIKSDMTTARDTFDENMDKVPESFSDPFGALAAIVLKSLTRHPSLQEVDAYAAEHCNSTVFGTNAAAL